MPPTLDRLEAALASILDRPLEQTIAELEGIARDEPDNPGPHLAIAMVSAFTREDFSRARSALKRASALLRRADQSDPEIRFARALNDVISGELATLGGERTNDLSLSDDEVRARLDAPAKGRRKAFDASRELTNAVRGVRESHLAQVIAAAIRALSRAFPVNGSAAKAGVTSLARLRETGASEPLAGLFHLYAHRRARNYAAALQSGAILERRHPSSALVKQAIGSCHFYRRDYKLAEDYYRQALSLDPENASITLGMARVLVMRGDQAALDEAAKLTERAEAGDREGVLKQAVGALRRDQLVVATVAEMGGPALR
jgi:tetratricopeptide (TPR) repeat protein